MAVAAEEDVMSCIEVKVSLAAAPGRRRSKVWRLRILPPQYLCKLLLVYSPRLWFTISRRLRLLKAL
jgi:hypothetical protein